MLVYKGYDAAIFSKLHPSMLESNGGPLGKEAPIVSNQEPRDYLEPTSDFHHNSLERTTL